MKKLLEENLITNEFIIITLLIILNFVLVFYEIKIDAFKELSGLIIGFIGRGMLNNKDNKNDINKKEV